MEWDPLEGRLVMKIFQSNYLWELFIQIHSLKVYLIIFDDGHMLLGEE